MSAGPVICCREDHLEAIRAIYNDAILHTTALYEYQPRSVETIQSWWQAKQQAGYPVLGVERADGTLAGFASWGPFRPFPAFKYSVEHSVYVAADSRGAGIGRGLLEAIIAEALRHDVHLLVGAIDATNAASLALHRAAQGSCMPVRSVGPDSSSAAGSTSSSGSVRSRLRPGRSMDNRP